MINAKILPSTLSGNIEAPPSKSMAHRLIICASLAEGESVIKNVATSDDISATISCMEALGGSISKNNNTLNIKSGTKEGEKQLFVNESGSTLRFLIPLCMTGEKITLKGSKRLFERPLLIYQRLCERQGIEFIKTEDSVTICGKLKPDTFEIAGDVSSQFISGLLFCLPLKDGDSQIKITGNFESKSYVLMTIDAMKSFGVFVSLLPDNTIKIKGNQKYRPQNMLVEGDWSNGAFFEALNYMGHSVSVLGLNENSLQGDKVFKDYFKKIKQKNAKLSLSDCPDLAPILFALSAYFGGGYFSDTKRLKLKESDRAEAMRQELEKFGAKLLVEENSVTVKEAKLKAPTEILSSHNDHRIAMALAVLLTVYGGEIADAGAVKKSMPDFWEKLKQLGAKVNLYEA